MKTELFTIVAATFTALPVQQINNNNNNNNNNLICIAPACQMTSEALEDKKA